MTASDDKSLKGKGHDFPPHDHEAVRHSHGHSHFISSASTVEEVCEGLAGNWPLPQRSAVDARIP
jgi:hypothetical protein